MELQHERPPAYVSVQPDAIAWPAVPQHLPQQRSPTATNITLPDLKTVLSPTFEQQSPTTTTQIRHGGHHLPDSPPGSVRSLPRMDAGQMVINDVRRSIDSTVASPVETGSVMSFEDRARRSTSVVSMDDPDVRMAAEALSGLGNPDFARSARGSVAHVSSHASPDQLARAIEVQGEPEPLLELISQAHPWVGGTIKGSLSAYSTTKYYSPRIVQYGANLVERNITTPVFSAVSSVGEMTGVEHGIRRYLDARRPGDADPNRTEESSHKRRRTDDTAMDIESGLTNTIPDLRRDSFESHIEPLPLYGSSRPPSYREAAETPAAAEGPSQTASAQDRPAHNRSWSSQIFVTTSGLSVALSTTSRRSLRYCLSLLSQSAQHVANLTTALSLILKEYEAARASCKSNSEASLEKGERAATPEQDEAARQLAGAIKQHCDDIWQTLRYVVHAVSNYAGGALPDNARHFVRQQLMSLPQRWRLVSDGQSGESETSRSAQRMIDFATEGLDMMTQVSGVLKATLDSAEKWLNRVGAQDRGDHEMPDTDMQTAPTPEKC